MLVALGGTQQNAIGEEVRAVDEVETLRPVDDG
jgi:hypothetical protein